MPTDKRKKKMKGFYVFCAVVLRFFGVKVWAIRVRTPAPFYSEVFFVRYRTNDFKRTMNAVYRKGNVIAYPITKRRARKLRQNENCFAG